MAKYLLTGDFRTRLETFCRLSESTFASLCQNLSKRERRKLLKRSIKAVMSIKEPKKTYDVVLTATEECDERQKMQERRGRAVKILHLVYNSISDAEREMAFLTLTKHEKQCLWQYLPKNKRTFKPWTKRLEELLNEIFNKLKEQFVSNPRGGVE